jgi:large subunit ribosomal protein L10
MTTEKKGAKKVSPMKTDAVAKLTDKLKKAKAFFLTDYRGLTHQQLETLKKGLKKVQGEFVIAKNTLLRIAMKQCSNETMLQLEKELNNPTAAFFAYGDEITAIKELANFIKIKELPKIKIGFFAEKIAFEDDFKKLASLAPKEVLLATLAGRMKGPLYGLHYGLNWNLQRLATVLGNVKSKKLGN